MTKQIIYLFVRALIIGILLNVSLHLVSDPLVTPQETMVPHQAEITISNMSGHVPVPFLDPINVSK